MRSALTAWMAEMGRAGDPVAAATRAAEADAGRPWDVVAHAGVLARCEVVPADRDVGLDDRLRQVPVDAKAALVRVAQGAPLPVPRNAKRSGRGAFDTPPEMARGLVRDTLAAARVRVNRGLDTACGAGAFLVALAEAGVPEIYGGDVDPAALAVARIAAPSAWVELADGLSDGMPADVVVGNPPYVSPERQDKALRARLRREHPWLTGRFDLAVPFAAQAVARTQAGGATGLIVTSAVLVQRYGAPLRRDWLRRHAITTLDSPLAFPGVAVQVARVVLRPGAGPAPVPRNGTPAAEILALDQAPLDPTCEPGDGAIAAACRAKSLRLGQLGEVDTGVVAHSAAGPRSLLLFDAPGPRRVRYADARDFFAGRSRWLDYVPERMHRAKRPDLFEGDKIVIQRVRGKRPVRAAIDRTGIYVGHTCTVVRPFDVRVPLERLLDLVTSPLVAGLMRLELGTRLDLYPRDVANLPVPTAWLTTPGRELGDAWGLTAAQRQRLMAAAAG